MANIVAKFEKVSLEEFKRAMQETFPYYEFSDTELEYMISEVPLPIRSTKKAAGYDFFTPFGFILSPGTSIVIPTGIRCNVIDESYFLMICPKSGIGCKTSIHLSNTLGIIDADYYQSDNEGHIMIKLEMPVDISNYSNSSFKINTQFKSDLRLNRKKYKFYKNQKFVQGIFIPYGITTNDEEIEKEDRNGGFGSTEKINE